MNLIDLLVHGPGVINYGRNTASYNAATIYGALTMLEVIAESIGEVEAAKIMAGIETETLLRKLNDMQGLDRMTIKEQI